MLGLFTTKAYAEPASQTPLLHRKLRQILRSEDLIEGSHDYKAAVSLFDSFPKDELFAASTDDLRGAVVALLALQGEQVRLLGRRDPDSRSASLIVALPRSRYNPELLARLQDLLRDRFETGAVDSHMVLGEGDRVQIHFRVHASEGLPDVDFRELEREVVATTRTWDDELRDALVARHGPMQGRVLATEWGTRFPRYYKASTTPALAVHDIGCFTRLETLGEPFVVGLQNESDERGERTRVGLYKSGGKVELSEAMPMLEDLGLRVIEEIPTRLRGGDKDTWVQDFGVLGPGDKPIDLEAHGARVADCISAVWRGDTESDTLNRLVLARRARLAPDRDPARLPQVPPAHRLALHGELPERRAGRERGDHARPRGAVRAALRPRARARRGRGGGAAGADRAGARRGRVARPRPHPAQPARADRGDAAHQRLPPRARGDELQAALGRRAGDPGARAAGRDLRLLGRDGGHPPARRRDRARRHPLVGPHGLPHRGLRPDAGAADQERPDRARGRQGRLLPQAPPVGPDRAARGGQAPVRRLRARPARRDRQPRRRRGRPPARHARARRARHLPRGRRRQGHGDVLGHRQQGRRRLRLLARRRVRLRRLVRL